MSTNFFDYPCSRHDIDTSLARIEEILLGGARFNSTQLNFMILRLNHDD